MTLETGFIDKGVTVKSLFYLMFMFAMWFSLTIFILCVMEVRSRLLPHMMELLLIIDLGLAFSSVDVGIICVLACSASSLGGSQW